MMQAPDPIFVYGTLRDADVLRLALGAAMDRLRPVAANLLGHKTLKAAAGPYPVLRKDEGSQAPGVLLLETDAAVIQALNFFEGVYNYGLGRREVQTDQGPVWAQVYVPDNSVIATEHLWELATWQTEDKALFLEMGAEIMAHGLSGAARGRGLLLRAIQRVEAQRGAPAKLRSRPAADAVTLDKTERLHNGFFAADALTYRHRRFDGATSNPLRREVFINGDAVCVLPWDPTTDKVLLIEQVRAGLVARGDPNPWNLEAIAGMQDQPESAEATARREAQEEAGLPLGRLVKVAEYYPSPGILTEFVTSFIAEADLSSHAEGIHGLASEDEDIRTLILPRSTAMEALQTGEIRNAPLIIALLALERMREQFLADWAH